MTLSATERSDGDCQLLPILTSNLATSAGLLPDLGTEALYLLDNETLHTINAVFFFEPKIKRLI